jgi:hypothetical protein
MFLTYSTIPCDKLLLTFVTLILYKTILDLEQSYFPFLGFSHLEFKNIEFVNI